MAPPPRAPAFLSRSPRARGPRPAARAARRAVRGLALALATGLGACGAGEPEAGAIHAWVDLAHGFRPAPLAELATALEAAIQPPRGGRLVPEGEALWFELPLPASAWEPSGEPGIWRMDEPRGGALLAGERDARVWRAALRDGAFAVLLLYPG